MVRRLVPSFYVVTQKKNHPTINRLLISEGAGVDFPAWLTHGAMRRMFRGNQRWLAGIVGTYRKIIGTIWEHPRNMWENPQTIWENHRKKNGKLCEKKTVKPGQAFLFRQAMFD
jgi:hypothetical protein